MIVDYLKDPINAAIQQHRVNNCVNKDSGSIKNLDKMYGLVWGQCSHGIKSIIHNKKYFKEKLDVFDFLWLLERMKEITSGMCVKSNNRYNTHKATLNFLAMNQWKQ